MFSETYNPMKRGVRLLYSILLLTAMAATFALRLLFHQNSFFQPRYEEASPVKNLGKPVFNETLLKLAAIDLGEPKLKLEIDELLEGKFKSLIHHRWTLSSGKYRIDLRVRSDTGRPLLIRSPEVLQLWLSFEKHLRHWFQNRRFSPDTTSNLADEVRSSIDGHRGKNGSGGPYKSCAVVGNSGILLNTDYGQIIDSHQIVIRLNNARIQGFETKVGSKTNISFINSNILHLCARREDCSCHPYGANVTIVMYICQPPHIMDYLVCNSSHKAPLIATDPHFDLLCSSIVKYYSLKRFIEKRGKDVGEWAPAHQGSFFHYSSGMQAVMVALGICERVSLFGFGKSETAKHHYHTNQRAELAVHDYEAEYDFYRDLVERPRAVPFISDKFEFPPVSVYH